MSKNATFVTLLPRGSGGIRVDWHFGKGAPAGVTSPQGCGQPAGGAGASPHADRSMAVDPLTQRFSVPENRKRERQAVAATIQRRFTLKTIRAKLAPAMRARALRSVRWRKTLIISLIEGISVP